MNEHPEQEPITPSEFFEIEKDYKMALERRRRAMLRESRTETQAEISRKWKVDISRVNRILKTKRKVGANASKV